MGDIMMSVHRRRAGRRKRSKDRRMKGLEINLESISIEIFSRRSPSLEILEVKQMTSQLGYIPYNLVEIAASSDTSLKHPLVAQLYPLNNNDVQGRYSSKGKPLPFPTMLWLCCPQLHSRISCLEDAGWIQKLHLRLTESSCSNNYLQAMDKAHKAYAQERWNLLSERDKQFVEENGWVENLKGVGIAGMKDFTAVKCLHCHYAHYLARPQHGNIIGEWVSDLLLSKEDCIPISTEFIQEEGSNVSVANTSTNGDVEHIDTIE